METVDKGEQRAGLRERAMRRGVRGEERLRSLPPLPAATGGKRWATKTGERGDGRKVAGV